MEPEHLSENTAVPKKTLTAAWIKSNPAGMGPRLAQDKVSLQAHECGQNYFMWLTITNKPFLFACR